MKLTRKLGILLLVMTVFLTTVFSFDLTTWAKKKPYMETLDVRWNLEPNKEIRFKTYFTGYDYITVKAKVRDFIIKDTEDDGYKKLTFTIDYRFPKLKLNKKQIDKIIKNEGNFYYMWTVLDYKTGKSLEEKNSLNVKVTAKEWKDSKDSYQYEGYKKAKFSYPKSSAKKVSVTYPKDYKDLCLMIGGSHDYSYLGDEFYNGTVPFGKTKFYKKDIKDLSTFMRIKDFE